ncbi:AIPR family protein [Nitrospina sp. 32_T5]|uniref:AIPR family protein n=1 Tax=unclassified Nitrospina TaxID=2638683 RepID=UPI003F9AC8B9
MTEEERFQSFSEDLLQEVISASDSQEGETFRINQFTQTIADYLVEAGEIDDITICHYKTRGMQMNGYNISQDEDVIDLFVSIFNQQTPPVTVTKTQCEAAFRQAETSLKKGFSGFHDSLEEASEAFDAFQRIHELRNQVTRCRIYLLTDGIVNQESFQAEDNNDISVSLHVWDIRRIFRFASSGKSFEPIEIDFGDEFEGEIPCLTLLDPGSDYQGYLAVIPGKVLAGIYGKYGPRLLERNVRSFLQARGKVNKGIRETIIKEPHRFFAYNNGITATADDIVFKEHQNGALFLKKVRNLQIVNGGQTTASLFHTAKKDKASLDGIYIQAKLSVIPEEHLDEIVPLISRFANSQNKVNDADFYANDPFHVKLEELSRTVWAPPVDGTTRQTKWFYERSRGQYQDAKAREGTPARKRQFEALHPNRQKFTKTDLAKYENTWNQLPYIVSLGAQKNFNDFAVQLKERGRVDVDITYFEHLVAKAILFKTAEKIVSGENYGGYRANIVTYTLAWLSHHTSMRINLDQIWKDQGVSVVLQDSIRTVSASVNEIITSPPQNMRNITEWCKKKACWEKIKEGNFRVHPRLEDELIDVSRGTKVQTNRGIQGPNEEEKALIENASQVPATAWFGIAKWAKETNNLKAWQRSLAFSLGKVAMRSGQPSFKQAKQGLMILEEAERLGFKV